jgi:hypothetical protein
LSRLSLPVLPVAWNPGNPVRGCRSGKLVFRTPNPAIGRLRQLHKFGIRQCCALSGENVVLTATWLYPQNNVLYLEQLQALCMNRMIHISIETDWQMRKVWILMQTTSILACHNATVYLFTALTYFFSRYAFQPISSRRAALASTSLHIPSM